MMILDKKFILELHSKRIGRNWVVQPKFNLMIHRANIELLVMKFVSENSYLLPPCWYIFSVATGCEYLF
jgi:hypothetical protein